MKLKHFFQGFLQHILHGCIVQLYLFDCAQAFRASISQCHQSLNRFGLDSAVIDRNRGRAAVRRMRKQIFNVEFILLLYDQLFRCLLPDSRRR